MIFFNTGQKIILVSFSAQWCGPCKLISTKLEELATQYLDRAIVINVDVDELEEVTQDFEISMMPTFVFLNKDKKTLDQVVGSKVELIEKYLEKHCKVASN